MFCYVYNMVQCSAFGCNNRGSHLFPTDKNLRKQWEDAVNRKSFHASKHSKLCSNHFKTEDYRVEGSCTGLKLQNKILKKGVVPSVFVWKNVQKNTAAEKKSARVKSRDVRRKLSLSQELQDQTESNILMNLNEVSIKIEIPAEESEATQEETKKNNKVQYQSKKNVQKNTAAEKKTAQAKSLDVRRKLSLSQKLQDQTESNILMNLNEVSIKIEFPAEESEATQEETKKNNEVQYQSRGTQRNFLFYTVETFRYDNKGIQFYTGLETFLKFKFVFSTLTPEAFTLNYRANLVLNLSAEDQFLLTLMKLRRNKEDYELARYFDIDPSLVSNIFITWINFMHQMWKMLDTWPYRQLVDFYMPEGFAKLYSTRVIVDCTEVPIKTPSNPAVQPVMCSSYENRPTVKLEVAESPNGLLSHCSEAYGGGTSDGQMVERSSLLNKCDRYPTRVKVDCTEVPIKTPSNPAVQPVMCSSYENRPTVKLEVAESPNGLLSHCSEAYGGGTSDGQMVERSSLLNKCDRYPTRVKVDCTEVPIKTPSNPAVQPVMCSSYENRPTVKLEVAESPNGLLSHCSEAYGGGTSDGQMVERSSLLNKCDRYPTRVKVDCTEVPIQKPSKPAVQQVMCSSYENRSTVKQEVGESPNGLLSHCSEAYGGSTSDGQMVEHSSLLNTCDRGDSVMADRGLNVQDLFASIIIPTFLKGKSQLPSCKVLQYRKLSPKCVHIEHVIGLRKTFKMLQVPIDHAYVPLLSKIYFVCQMLCNFREGIVSGKA